MSMMEKVLQGSEDIGTLVLPGMGVDMSGPTALANSITSTSGHTVHLITYSNSRNGGDVNRRLVKHWVGDVEDVLRRMDYNTINLVGTSLGAGIGAYVLTQEIGSKVGKVVFRSPMFSIPDNVARGISSSGSVEVPGEMRPYHLPEQFVDDARGYEVSERIQTPSLIICGSDDPLVPENPGKIFGSIFRNGEIEILQGGNHLLQVNGSTEKADKMLIEYLR